MPAAPDKSASLLFALGAHVLLLAALWATSISCEGWNRFVVAAKLPELLIVECRKPLNVEGPVIEAMLMTDVGALQTQPQPQPTPTPPPPPIPPPPTPEPEAPEPAPPVAEDPIDQERIARDGELPALEQQRREQEERRKREQVELQERERLATLERERERELQEIRRERELAERERELEESRLAQLDRQRDLAQQRFEQLSDREPMEVEGIRAGTGGTDTALLGRYVLAVTQVVTRNWLRPDTTQPGLECTVRIIQVPGGDVVSATVVEPCNGDDLTRRSLEAAVLRAQLPYAGFEPVFERSINFVFRYEG